MAASAKRPLVSDTTLLVVFAFACLMITFLHKVDPAVAQSWPNNPYSPLWFLLNPFAWTGEIQYRVSLTAFDAIAFFFGILAVRRYGLPFNVMFANVCVQLVWALLGWEENVTVTAFAWAAWFFWPLALFAAQKLPIGWSLNFQDAHVRCLTACFYYAGNAPTETGLLLLLDRDLLHYVVYAVIAFMVLYPIAARYGWRRVFSFGVWK